MSLQKKIDKLESIAAKTAANKTNKKNEKEEETGDLSWKEFGFGLGILNGNPLTSIGGLLIGSLLDRFYGTHKGLKETLYDLPKNLSRLQK